MKNYDEIDAALKAVAPVIGTRFVEEDDPSTWIIQFAEDTTDEQKEPAYALIKTLRLTESVPVPDPILSRLEALESKVNLLDTPNGVLVK